jgi:hypothetical protein
MSPVVLHSDLELPYGVAQDGRMVAVDQVARGLACQCRCPQCDRRLIARQGEILAWHFAHEAAEINCVGAFETMTHKLAKQIIADAGMIRIPALIGYLEGYPYRVIEEAREVVLTDVRLEVWLGGIRPDILARRDDGTDLAIEVYVAHRSEAEKIDRIRDRQLATIEIDLSGFRSGLLTGDIFPEAVLRGPARNWLWNPRQAEANAIVVAEQEERRAKERAAAAVAEAARQEAGAKAKAASLAREEAARKFYTAEHERRAALTEPDRLEFERRDRDRRAKQVAELVAIRATAASASDQRIAFLRSRPVVPVAIKLAPSCKCRTFFLWRHDAQHPWQCFACDTPLVQSDGGATVGASAVEVIRADLTSDGIAT